MAHFINSISELSYYDTCKITRGYCEQLNSPSDFLITFSAGGINVTEASIYAYTSDGTNLLGDISAYFTVATVGGQVYITMNSFPPIVCSEGCFVINVILTLESGVPYFNRFTNTLCTCCCDDSIEVVVDGEGAEDYDDVSSNSAIVGNCTDPYVKLKTWSDCANSFIDGVYTATYPMVTNIKGRLIREPREIVVERSINCKAQKIESYRTYLLEGWDFYPQWKMDEIESQLHSQYIMIDDVQYYVEEGAIFEREEFQCCVYYRLRARLRECRTQQLFGCRNICLVENEAFYVICEDGLYYDENMQIVAYSIDQFLQYLNGLDGVTSVEVNDGIIHVTGNGYLPSYYYCGGLSRDDRFYSYPSQEQAEDSIPTYNCTTPEFGTVVVEESTCTTPELGTAVVTSTETATCGDVRSLFFQIEVSGSPAEPTMFYDIADLIGVDVISVEVDGIPITDNPSILSPITLYYLFDSDNGRIEFFGTLTGGENVQVIYKHYEL